VAQKQAVLGVAAVSAAVVLITVRRGREQSGNNV